jgi:beta-glucanase (GH16 family)
MAPATAFAVVWQLFWSDEFSGSAVDTDAWTFEIGDGCPNLCNWGNDELQYYRAQNATVAGGLLTIQAKAEFFNGYAYTSARMHTRAIGGWRYGRIEIRAKLPAGRGLWPALWMMPTDDVYGTWAASGEIDIMEMRGQEPSRVIGVIHYGGEWPANVSAEGAYVLQGATFADDFHVFALEWEEGRMRWYVDDVLFATRTTWWSSGGAFPAPFDQRFHVIMNLAVGGSFPGPPDGTTVFPASLVVDYVRVYQDPETTEAAVTTNPSSVSLQVSRPNPFREDTAWTFELPRPAAVHVAVFDVHGRHVRTLMHGHLSEGSHAARWDGLATDGTRVASGVYECVLSTGGEKATQSVSFLH